MATLTANFETGTNGNTVATSDTGSANAWDVVTISATDSITYDNTYAYGTLSGKYSVGSTLGTAMTSWSTSFGPQTEHWGRAYVYFTANPAVTPVYFIRSKNVASNTRAAAIGISTGGMVLLEDAGGTVQGTSTNAISLNQWVRIEYHFIHSLTTGFIEAKLFNSPNSATPTETITSASNLNTSAQAATIDFGNDLGSGIASYTFWLDNIQSNTTAYPGPLLTASVSQVAANITATGGTQVVATVNDAAVSQVGANLTITGGTQTVATVNDAAISQSAATLTVTGGTQVVATVDDVAISQTSANLVLSGGTQTIATVNIVSITQTAANLILTGGTQTIATVNTVSITQVSANLRLTGGTQLVAGHTGTTTKPPNVIFLTDGRIAVRLSNTVYMPL